MNKDECVYLNWPITFRWAWGYGAASTWFKTHGICLMNPYCYWVFHLGPLKIIFGEKTCFQIAKAWNSGFDVGVTIEPESMRKWYKQSRGLNPKITTIKTESL